MSRIGNAPITVPSGVEISISSGLDVTVKGPKGTLEHTIPDVVSLSSRRRHGHRSSGPTTSGRPRPSTG